MEWKNERVCDVLNLILGAFLFFTPWIFGFAAGAETQNAMISGIIIAVLSIAALAAFMEWEEWLNLVAGLWVLVSPWLLGFANTTAMGVHVIVGILVVVIAAVELWMMHRPGRLTASR
jgi:SPW repeat